MRSYNRLLAFCICVWRHIQYTKNPFTFIAEMPTCKHNDFVSRHSVHSLALPLVAFDVSVTE